MSITFNLLDASQLILYVVSVRNRLQKEAERVRSVYTWLTIVLGCLMTWTLLAASCSKAFSKKKRALTRSQSRQALLAFITPTLVAWPSNYEPLLHHRTCNRSKIIRIQAFLLLSNICSGTIELRDVQDLSYLFCDRLRIYGWSILLEIGFSWRFSVLQWVLISQFPSFSPPTEFKASNSKKRLAKQFSFPAVLDETTTPNLRHLPQPPNISSTVYLDFIAPSDLASALRFVQSRLIPGAAATLEFTTIAPDITLLSDAFALCAVPFMPRMHARTDAASQRTTTPLLTSLHRVVELLAAAGPVPVTIESVTNATAAQITALWALHSRLLADRGLRSALIDKWGEEGWREHRLMVAWEAGLLAAGYISRWIVVVRK